MSTQPNSLQHIIDMLGSHGIKAKYIPHMCYILEHNYTKEEFESLIPQVLSSFAVKPQNDDWYPGTPTGHSDDWGFYICPQEPDMWAEGDFDMAIYIDTIHWC